MKTMLRSLGFWLVLAFAVPAGAQISITSYPYSYTQAFTGFNGTAAGLPAGWTVAGAPPDRGTGTGTSNAGGIWGYGVSPEFALGALCSGSASTITYKVTFTNNGGNPINGLTISYDFEQWRVGGGNTNGFTVTQTGIGGVVSSLSQNSANSMPSTPTVTAKSVTLTGLNIAPGATFSLSWSISDGTGSDNGVAIDNFMLTATTSAVTPPDVTVNPVNDTACAGTAASFAITATNATTYQWQEFITSWTNITNGGVYSGATTNTLNISNAAGMNGRRYRAIAGGSATTDTSTAALLTVYDLPAISTQPLPAIVCDGQDTALRINATGSALTYQWQEDQGAGGGFVNLVNNATYQGTTTNVLQLHTPAAGMSGWRYRCIVSGKCSPAAVSDTVALTVHPSPIASITPAAAFSFCAGDSVTFSTSTGTGINWQWYRNNTAIAGATSATHRDSASGTYSVVAINTFGCADTSVAVTATAVPHAATVTALSTTAFCNGDSVILQANTGAGFTYSWLSGTNTIAGAVSGSLVVNTTGSFRVVVTNSIGCRDTSAAVTTTANAGPVAVISVSGVTNFCIGDSVVLNAGAVPGLTYEWFRNGNPIGATGSLYTADSTGNYTVKVSSAVTCYSVSAPVPVVVHALPPAPLRNLSAAIFCSGDSVMLTTDTGFYYQWTKDGTAIPGAGNDSLIVKTGGIYSVTVISNFGCYRESDTILVTVRSLPAATITPSGNQAICQGDSLLLQANAGALLSYQWYKDGNALTGQTGTQYSYKLAGAYRVRVTDSNGCSATSAAATLAVNALPSVVTSLSGNTTFCAGNNVVVSVPSVSGLSYQWQRNGVPVTGNGASIPATTDGNYRVIVTNTATGCKDSSAPVAVTVYPLPVANLAAANATSFCEGDSVRLDVNTGAGRTYKWLFNTLPVAGISTPYRTVKVSGDYAVEVTDSNQCHNTSNTVQVVVHELPNSIITYSAPLFFCDGGAVVLTANNVPGSTYQWLKDGTPQGITTYSNIVSQSGVYTVIQTNSFNCSKLSPGIQVTVWPKPAPVITRNGMELSTGAYAGYQWYVNNQAITNANGRTWNPQINGGYMVEVTDSNGCHAQTPVAFVNNVGVSQVKTSDVRIFPNPVTDVLHITAPVPVSVTVSNIQGQVVSLHELATAIEVRGLAPGTYFVRVTDKQGLLIRTEKITSLHGL